MAIAVNAMDQLLVSESERSMARPGAGGMDRADALDVPRHGDAPVWWHDGSSGE